ncbi:MAG: hypothetical protein WCH78_09925 [Bacteroidota bacterium]
MYKGIFLLYFVCFSCYVLFTRQPDYFDGDRVPAIIMIAKDSVTGKQIHLAEFSNGYKNFKVKADYYLRSWKNGEKTEVIYETEHPEKGAVYGFWGYWIGLGELIASVVFIVVSYQIAVSITKNPTPEALLEQLNYKEPNKPRYD